MESMRNPFEEVFLNNVQSFDLKLHWSFHLTGICRDSYNTCISFCKNTFEQLLLFTEAWGGISSGMEGFAKIFNG